jgi:O-antigen ligase
VQINAALRARPLDRKQLTQIADWAAVAVAVSLPWSTSATSILVVVWLLALLPSEDWGLLRQEIETPAGGLPVLLVLLGVAGLFWADVSWAERFGGLRAFHRLLMIPLLLVQFQRSERGVWVLYGFFLSVVALLFVSWFLVLTPGLPWRGRFCVPESPLCYRGVPVNDYISQSTVFTVCMFAAVWRSCDLLHDRRFRMAFLLAVLAALFLASMTFVQSSRTALVVLPFLILLFAWRRFGWKGILIGFAASGVLAVGIWEGSSYVRDRVAGTIDETQRYLYEDQNSSTAGHAELAKKAVSIIRQALIIGHGTGSIGDMFRREAIGKTGLEAVQSVNPHNQILNVGIQLGLAGVVILIAMWIAHYSLFRAGNWVSWSGTVVVVENIVSSLFNSHLFDFMHSWLYVFGVGVVGGMVLRKGAAADGTQPRM